MRKRYERMNPDKKTNGKKDDELDTPEEIQKALNIKIRKHKKGGEGDGNKCNLQTGGGTES